jgi:hypothetical protein
MNGQLLSKLKPGWKTKLQRRNPMMISKKSFNISEINKYKAYSYIRRDLELMK